jgi:hypothetical protein
MKLNPEKTTKWQLDKSVDLQQQKTPKKYEHMLHIWFAMESSVT